jgi:iron(III) transport system permease protein
VLNVGLGVLIGVPDRAHDGARAAPARRVCMLPLAVPGLVMAFGYVALTLAGRSAGARSTGQAFDLVGAEPQPVPAADHRVRRAPAAVHRAVERRGARADVGRARGGGDEPGGERGAAIRSVVLPLITANLIAGGLLVFSFSMLEVSDSLILAQREVHYPITKMIYELHERLGDGPYIASAMGVWGMGLLTVTLLGASLLLGKKLGAIFRV